MKEKKCIQCGYSPINLGKYCVDCYTKLHDKNGQLRKEEVNKMELNYYCMDMEELNVNDAKEWFANGKMIALVSEEDGGIIGYTHQAHEDKILTVLNKELVEAEKFDELNYSFMDMEEQNISDANEWLEKDEMVAIVSEEDGGIIGYIHRSHEDKLSTLLNA